jgi:hypothetical protein
MWSSSCGGPTPPLSLLVMAPGVNQLTSHKRLFIILAMRRAIVFEDRVYVLGGFDGTSRLRSVECFTPGPPGSRPRWHQVGSFEVNSPGRPGCQGGRHVGTSLQLLRGHPQWSSFRDGRLQARLQKKFLSRDIVIIMVKMNLAGRRPGRWRAVCATWWTSTAPPPTSSSQSFHLDKM